MYSKFNGIINTGSCVSKMSAEYKLKQFHHVRLDKEFKLDCAIWLEFLQGNLQNVVNRPMVDQLNSPVTDRAIGFYSDVSASKSLGFGAILNTKWIQGDWGEQFIVEQEPSIEFLELFALCAGVFT